MFLRMSFGLKLGLAIFLLAVGSTSLSVLYFYQSTSELVLRQMRARMHDLANAGSLMFSAEDRAAIRRLTENMRKDSLPVTEAVRDDLYDPESENEGYWESLPEEAANRYHASRDFNRVAQVLRRIKASGGERALPIMPLYQTADDPSTKSRIKYAYIMVPVEGFPNFDVLKFLVDADWDAVDMNANGEIDEDEEASPAGLVWYADEPVFYHAFAGEIFAAEEWYTDKWGTWLTSAAPILDKDGNILAVVALDLDVKSEANRLAELRQAVIGIISVSVALSLLVSFGLARFLHRPIELLRQGADRVRERDFDTFITLRRRDELGLLADTFNDMVSEIREYARHLEDKVAERTARLQESLGRVQELKAQQDGDYFLTNLLANPLFKNWNTGDAVRTDFILRQKKKFQFRGRPGELGGDLCITGNLILQNRPCTMFLNADAMGKSMQGAGGALVMGTVVNAIMHRSEGGRDISPEGWLRETFRELHGVFYSFDGTMAISAVLGIVDDATGMLHYFNAEHPFPVLIRDGKAEFIEEEAKVFKIGIMQQSAGDVHIEHLQLRPGDVLICGSDGRDDLRVIDPETGESVVLHDGNPFQEICEKSGGDLQRMVELIQERGELTDDLSLIRVEFTGAAVDAPRREPSEEDSRSLIKAVIALVQSKDYERALETVESVSTEYQGMLYHYYRGLCLHKLGRSRDALASLEQAHAINKSQTAVPELIAGIHYRNGNFAEAERFWKETLKLEPNHSRARQALEKLKAEK